MTHRKMSKESLGSAMVESTTGSERCGSGDEDVSQYSGSTGTTESSEYSEEMELTWFTRVF